MKHVLAFFGAFNPPTRAHLELADFARRETGADGVKLEGGREMRAAIEMILRAGIPVMGHLGLTPQSINKFGTYEIGRAHV